MPKIQINGLKYHYWQVGLPGAPNVLMLHGLGGNLAVWYAGLVQNLWSDFYLTTVDMAAHGNSDSPGPGYTLDRMLDDMRLFLDRLGIDKVHIIGHCLGGDLALNFALVYPERVGRVIIIETVLADLAHLYASPDWEGWAYYAAELEKYTGELIPTEQRNDPAYLLQKIQEAPLMHGVARGRKRNPKHIERMVQGMEMIRQAHAELADLEEANLQKFMASVTVDNLHQIPHPVLMIYEQDSFFLSSHDELRSRLPNTQSAFVPPAAIKHLSVLDRSKTMAAYCLAFLRTGTVAYVTAEDIARAEATPI